MDERYSNFIYLIEKILPLYKELNHDEDKENEFRGIKEIFSIIIRQLEVIYPVDISKAAYKLVKDKFDMSKDDLYNLKWRRNIKKIVFV